MRGFQTIMILLAAFLVVFAQSTVEVVRRVLGAQVDLLPSLVVYASLSGGVVTLALLALWGGLWFDSMSANPLGISVLPLFLIGFVIQRYRGLILRDETFAHLVLGLIASAAMPLLTLLLLFNAEKQPLIGWFSLWQWVVMSLAGAAASPLWFRLFDRLNRTFSYRSADETAFRSDREIKRGRF